MKNRTMFRSLASMLLTTNGGIALIGCGGQPATSTDTTTNAALAAIVACGLDDGTIERDAHLHACDPQDVKKTTICHIPPGNPANAHTICVGNAAVSHHVANHGDSVGPCQTETTCPPPTPSCETSHGKGDDDNGGNGGACSASTGGTTGSGGGTGAGGSPGATCLSDQVVCGADASLCPQGTTCVNGCCEVMIF